MLVDLTKNSSVQSRILLVDPLWFYYNFTYCSKLLHANTIRTGI